MIGVFEADFEIELEIGAAPGARLAPGAAHELAEQVVEHIGEIAAEVETAGGAVAALLEGGMAEPVIGRALVVVLQDVIGLVDFLEADFAVVVAGIAVGVVLLGETAIGGFDIRDARRLFDSEDVVKALLRHV